MTDDQITCATLDTAVTEWLDITAELDKLSTRKAELAAEIIGKVGVGGTHQVTDNLRIRVQAGQRRFDPARAVAQLPPEWLALCMETRPSARLATANLPAYLLELTKSEPGEPTVRIV